MKKIYIGIIIFIVLIGFGIGISFLTNSSNNLKSSSSPTVIVGAVGGGKENLLNDEEFNRILLEKYNLVLENHAWSNNKMITNELTYTDSKGKTQNYDFAFFSDERFYEYYKQPEAEGEAPRLKYQKGAIALNTPIVIYSWDEVCQALISEDIVSEKNGVYYISDTEKLLSYISELKTWSDIGITDMYGKINIASTDPVTSSPGATYYGLLASIMNGGYVDNSNIDNVMPRLKDFYTLSGFMNNTPADLFDLYMRMGRGAYPLVVDYEKSMIDFANTNPKGFEQVSNRMRILYPQPTIWNSHCILSFSDGGTKFMDALNDKEIQELAWEKYGFRTGLTGGQYDVLAIDVKGVPQEIVSVTQGLKKEVYDKIINGLKD